MTNPIQTIKDLTQSALGDINAATTLADLEKVRVAVLGRKGELAGISKSLAPWRRKIAPKPASF